MSLTFTFILKCALKWKKTSSHQSKRTMLLMCQPATKMLRCGWFILHPCPVQMASIKCLVWSWKNRNNKSNAPFQEKWVCVDEGNSCLSIIIMPELQEQHMEVTQLVWPAVYAVGIKLNIETSQLDFSVILLRRFFCKKQPSAKNPQHSISGMQLQQRLV